MTKEIKLLSEIKAGEISRMKSVAFVPRIADYTPIVVHYLIAGTNVFFSSTTSNTTSSFDCAEEILTHIWRKEGFNPLSVNFFDINTHLGYRDLAPGEVRIAKLELDHKRSPAPGSIFAVRAWHLLEAPVGYPIPTGTGLTGIPAEIRARFASCIGTRSPSALPVGR